jgi:hypothetical protein
MFGGRLFSVLRSPSAYAEALAEALGIAFAKLSQPLKLYANAVSGAKLAEGKCLGHFSVSLFLTGEFVVPRKKSL